ncbi:type VI secretion protein [Streptomyces sp. NBC_01754]|uniref:type VI secretion protein n=1 Tax=Streptomyces sp. NBC_01754 TaxID=2975930 RepID=UPI002DD9B278|nr:type VI secretion protein [Streptomyces sp. NBC_01754]WSC93891.1 type VI secretion protein [Streptomyces sp. NBC_01754]
MARPAPSRTEHGGQAGGIPDGLLIGLLSFLFGATVLAWTATGLAGVLAHGAWPSGVTFTRTPLALRDLAVAPQDLPAAWPDTPEGELSGYGLFWGLFIGELMVLIVLTVFVLGVVARWRLVRRRRAEEAAGTAETEASAAAGVTTGPATGYERRLPADAPAALRQSAHRPERPPVSEPPSPVPRAEPPSPTPQAPASAEPVAAPVSSSAPTPGTPATVPSPRGPALLYGTAATRRPTAVQAVLDAEGPVLVVTSDVTLWAETKDARAKLGPVLVYDPGHLCDTPGRLRWSPTAGCEDPTTAAARAAALLAPVRPRARIDAAVADTAQTLLQCWLHAAAVDGRPFRQVHRWASGGSAHEPVRLLRTHPRAASGLAGLLESALTAYPERRDVAQQLTDRAFAALSAVHIRDACTPNRNDALALDSFAAEGGTLYMVGESIEDPRHRPGAMPLLTALASHVVEHGRRMAARSTDGRLDPPMTLVLDDVAAVAPLPQLPELLRAGQEQGMSALVLLRSQEQARSRWHDPLPAPEPY